MSIEQKEILLMLRDIVANNQEYTTWTVSTPHLVMLVNKAVEAEREICAEVCEILLSNDCAAAIRARSNTNS